MSNDTERDKQGVRWGVVCLISAIVLIGILLPKLMLMIDGYRSVVRSWSIDLQYLVHPTFRMLLVAVGWALVMRLNRGRDSATCSASMGLRVGWGAAFKGVLIGIACSLPMLALGLASDSFIPTRYEIMHGAISPGVTEEILFRAFFFGLLVQVARCPIWTTAIVTGVVFGLAHVDLTPDEGQTIIGQIGPWIAMIGLGGFMYAWLYWESRWNLWLVIALHAGMNLWWGMFDLMQTPLGSWGATGARIVSVGLVVLFVVGLRVFGTGPGATISHEYTTIDT